jgi:hypothetical protein
MQSSTPIPAADNDVIVPLLDINSLNKQAWLNQLVAKVRATNGQFGASGYALLNNQLQVIPKVPTEDDLLPNGACQYEQEPNTSELTDRSFSLYRDDMRRWIVTNDKRIADDNALYGLAYRTTSVQSILFMKTDSSWSTIESQDDGNKSITYINPAIKLHSSKNTGVMLKRALEMFSIQHSDSLLSTLDDVTQQIAQFTSDHSLDGKTVSIDTLHCVAIFNILQGDEYQAYRDFCLNDEDLLTDPVKLVNSLIKFMTARKALTSVSVSQQGSYVAISGLPTKRQQPSTVLPTKRQQPTSVPYCNKCFIRTKGRKFTNHGTPGTPACNNGVTTTTTTGLRQPQPSQQTTPDQLLAANRAYIAHYQTDPASEESINALVAIANMCN